MTTNLQWCDCCTPWWFHLGAPQHLIINHYGRGILCVRVCFLHAVPHLLLVVRVLTLSLSLTHTHTHALPVHVLVTHIRITGHS